MDEQQLNRSAEEVTAYLVTLRGGAPFLSGSDSRLLVDWLDAGVPVATILTALDGVAERRQRRRVRSRLTLSSARTAIRKAMGAPQHEPVTDVAASGPDMQPACAAYAAEVCAMQFRAEDEPHQAKLIAAIRDASTGSLEEASTAVISACRAFHDACWAQLSDAQRRSLESDARQTLAALVDTVPASTLDALVEEAARATLRSRYPLISAKQAWTRLGGHAK